jgi:hypothetical protein
VRDIRSASLATSARLRIPAWAAIINAKGAGLSQCPLASYDLALSCCFHHLKKRRCSFFVAASFLWDFGAFL